MHLRYFAYFFVAIFLSSSLLAGAQVPFEHFSTEHGLSQNSVLCLIQDRRGYLWIGTEDGLNRFDGHTFKKFRSTPYDTLSLPKGAIWSLMEDSRGRIWIGDDTGITFFDFADHRFHQVVREVGVPVMSSFEDSRGDLWFGTAGSGLIKISSDLKINRHTNSQPLTQPYDQKTWDMVINYVLTIHEHENGLLLGTRGAGLFIFRTGSFHRIPQTQDSEFAQRNDIWSILRDDDKWYFGSTKGLGVFSNNLSQEKIYTASGEPHSLSNNRIARLCANEDKGLWIATYGGGLNYFDFASEQFTVYNKGVGKAVGLPSDLAFTVLLDNTKNLWVGTWAGGLSKLNRHALDFRTYNSAHGLKDEITKSLSSKGDTTFVATYGGGVYWLDEKGSDNGLQPFAISEQLNPRYINSIYAGSKLWVGLDGGGVALTDLNGKKTWGYYKKIPGNEHSINNHIVSVVLEDKYGTVWVGTRGSGLKRIYPEVEYGTLGCIQHFGATAERSKKLSSNTVTSLFMDSVGYLWIGTPQGLNRSAQVVTKDSLPDEFVLIGDGAITSLASDGANVWAGTQTGLYKVMNGKLIPQDGLTEEYINAIVCDKKNVVWVSTNTGIFGLYPDGRLQHFTSADGLQSNEFNILSGSMTRNGQIVFGGVKGFNVFDPNNFYQKGTQPNLVISNTIINSNNQLNEVSDVTLAHTDKIIEFEFSALDFTNPSLHEYQYKLVGFDKEWKVSPANVHKATYTNLDPGQYTFSFKARTTAGVWNQEGRQITVTVLPPPWKTGWAYSAYALTILGVAYATWKNIINRERLKAKLKLEELQLEKLKELDGFKSKFFTNISHELRTPLTLILGHADALLENNRDSTAPIKSIKKNGQVLLDMVNQILDLSKIDAGRMELSLVAVNVRERLAVSVDAFRSLAEQKGIGLTAVYPEENDRRYCDPSVVEKICNNLLSNAIKYTPVGGQIWFSARLDDQKLYLQVKDNGIGMAPEHVDKIFDRFYRASENGEGTGIGLALTNELVNLHGGEIQVQSTVGQGTVFDVMIHMGRELAPETSRPNGHFHQALSKKMQPIQSVSPSAAQTEKSMDEKPVLLIVEDNDELRNFLHANLTGDYEILLAKNGDEGLAIAVQHVPEIILSDWMMPGKTGIQLCHDIKTTEATSHIPVILLTAKAGIEPKLEGLETGADEYLTKPFEMRELKARMKNLIAQRNLLHQKFSKTGLQEYKHVKVSSLDEQFIKKLYTSVEKELANADLTVEGLSRELGVSRVQLHRKAKALTGLAASDLIRDYRLQRAADLFRQKAGNVSEIAYKVGFENLSYFAKAFKQKYQVPPSEYPPA
jgi:signal transduction histidine kinase/DNA-binding response OmpR family regulator/ligand-binding sensor domain-containing protein